MTPVLVTGAVTTPLAHAAVSALRAAGLAVAGPRPFAEAAVAVAVGDLAPDAAVVVGAGADGRRDALVLTALGVPVVTADDERALADLAHAVAGVRPPAGAAGSPIESDQLRATIAWLAGDPLLRGRSYTLRHRGGECAATVAPIKHRLDLETLEPVPATRLAAGEVGECDLELDATVALGGDGPAAFVLHDRISGAPAGVGIARFALRRAANLRWQPTTVDAGARARALGQRPSVLWLTGLSGAGKSTIANRVEALLHARGRHTYLLDGDNVRHGLNRDLGFTDADRVENIRRVAEVARLMADAGLIVLVSFISPFASERAMARELIGAGAFYEVFVDTPLHVAEARDPKGLYAKARRGELANFTGIDSAYEPPEHPELRIDTTRTSPEDAALAILALLDGE